MRIEEKIEKLKFKNKRQMKDFETIYYNVNFDDVKNAGLHSDIICDVSNLTNEDIQQLKEFIKNNKNYCYVENRKALIIS